MNPHTPATAIFPAAVLTSYLYVVILKNRRYLARAGRNVGVKANQVRCYLHSILGGHWAADDRQRHSPPGQGASSHKAGPTARRLLLPTDFAAVWYGDSGRDRSDGRGVQNGLAGIRGPEGAGCAGQANRMAGPPAGGEPG